MAAPTAEATGEVSLVLTQALAIPKQFSKAVCRNFKGNQHTENKGETQLDKRGLAKRVNSKFQTALIRAPTHVQQRKEELAEMKGKRGSGIQAFRKQMLYKWVSDPEWEDSFFKQSLNLSEMTRHKVKGTWITNGRLENLIGIPEAKIAIDEKWWPVRKGKGSMVLIYYTEEGDEYEKTKELSKETRGGTRLDTDAAKKMMVEGIDSSFSLTFTGHDEGEDMLDMPQCSTMLTDNDVAEEEEHAGAMGVPKKKGKQEPETKKTEVTEDKENPKQKKQPNVKIPMKRPASAVQKAQDEKKKKMEQKEQTEKEAAALEAQHKQVSMAMNSALKHCGQRRTECIGIMQSIAKHRLDGNLEGPKVKLAEAAEDIIQKSQASYRYKSIKSNQTCIYIWRYIYV
jgi:hypothetical protein